MLAPFIAYVAMCEGLCNYNDLHSSVSVIFQCWQ